MTYEHETPDVIEERLSEISGDYHLDWCSVNLANPPGDDSCTCGLVQVVEEALAGLTILGVHRHAPGPNAACRSCQLAEAEYARMAL